MAAEERKTRRVLDEQGNVVDLEGFAGHTAKETPPVPEDLQRKNTDKEPFYGKTTDPEALYDKRRVREEG